MSNCCGSVSSSSFGGMRKRSIGMCELLDRRSPAGDGSLASPQPFAFGVGSTASPSEDVLLKRRACRPTGRSAPPARRSRSASRTSTRPRTARICLLGAAAPVHSSSNRWAFTPPKPKPLTAAPRARRRAGPTAPAAAAPGTARPRSAARRPARAKFACGGSVPAFIASSTFATAAAPAPVSRCPTVDFTEPIAHCPAPSPIRPRVRAGCRTRPRRRRRAGRVALDQVHVVRLPPGALVGPPHRPELALLRRGEQVAVHVVRQPDAGDDRVDRVAVRERVGESLEHEDARPLADHEAVGGGVERRTPARGRQAPGAARSPSACTGSPGREQPPASIASARPREQFVGRELDRVQRRRARRVERVTPAAEAEPLREQARRQPRDVAVERMRRSVADEPELCRRGSRGTGRSTCRSAGRCCRARRRRGRGPTAVRLRARQARLPTSRTRWNSGSSSATSVGSRSRPVRSGSNGSR